MEKKEEKQKRLPMQTYSAEFKRAVCADYLAGGVSKVSLLKIIFAIEAPFSNGCGNIMRKEEHQKRHIYLL